MSDKLKEFEEKAMGLPSKDRALLAIRLIESLDRVDDDEAERLWVEEAQRRYENYKAGLIPSRDAKSALNEARAAFR